MPTGYTAGILDGEIETLEEFAKTCMRAFGATIHMRDEPISKQYKPQKPSKYHKEQITKAEGELEHAKRLSDEEILERHHEKIDRQVAREKESIKKAKRNYAKLCGMLDEVKEWKPPTEDHQDLKDFMIQQLEKTMDFDCTTKYSEERLEKYESEKGKSASDIRQEMITEAEKNIKYHKEEYEKEVKRCEDSNEWVETLIKSL